jgi:hypothetical protein
MKSEHEDRGKIFMLTFHDVLFSAERVGFEPTVAQWTTTVFETVPFNRSGTSPCGGANYILKIIGCNFVRQIDLI